MHDAKLLNYYRVIANSDPVFVIDGILSADIDFYNHSDTIVYMNKTVLKERILGLESELQLIKQALEKEPDFKVDEENWRRTKNASKNIRKKLFAVSYGKKKGFPG